ncbi:hypothetical protein EDD18DRAFT_1077801, partial [Armillaria luteobubalina]
AAHYIQLMTVAILLYASPSYWTQPYHTSALSGAAWVNELVHGHPERIQTELGVHLHVFIQLIAELHLLSGLADSRNVFLEEQVAIFLYTCVTGLTV